MLRPCVASRLPAVRLPRLINLRATTTSSFSLYSGPLTKPRRQTIPTTMRRNGSTRIPTPDISTPTTAPQEKSLPTSPQPLRILFCGSDALSCVSLETLFHEHKHNSAFIESIDVVHRPSKPVGRGYKEVKHSMIKEHAEYLKLPTHEVDTFRGWDMPPYINLIIAVSFGLLVPARLIDAALYGGLNVHPSLLPDLHGAAPLQHALMDGDQKIGITVQTLHKTKLDGGLILEQTRPEDLISVPHTSRFRFGPNDGRAGANDLVELVQEPAAELLLRVLRKGAHIPPLQECPWRWDGKEPRPAPKINTQDRHLLTPPRDLVDQGKRHGKTPSVWEAAHIERRQRIIGPLWFEVQDPKGKKSRRVLITDCRAVSIRRKGDSEYVVNDQREPLDLWPNQFTIDSPPPPSTAAHSSGPSPKSTRKRTSTPILDDSEHKDDRTIQMVLWYEQEEEEEEEEEDEEPVYVMPAKLWMELKQNCLNSKYGSPVSLKDGDSGCLVLKIIELKVEGEKSKPAATVLSRFAEPGDALSQMVRM